MEHFHLNIPGWMDFENIYDNFVNEAQDGDRIVEVGAWCGQSVAYLAVSMINSGKNLRLHVVDTFKGSPTEQSHTSFVGMHGGDIFRLFVNYTEPIIDKFIIHKKDSIQASKDFDDESIAFLFLDSDHTYQHVMTELHAWFPKVKTGGIIAGHDYTNFNTVREAVNEFFTYNKVRPINTDTSSWLVRK